MFYSYYADIGKISNFGIFLGNSTLKSNIARTTWPISVIHISLFRIFIALFIFRIFIALFIFRIFIALSYETNLQNLCS